MGSTISEQTIDDVVRRVIEEHERRAPIAIARTDLAGIVRDAVAPLLSENNRERMFPLQANWSRNAAPGPLSIPWSIAEKAYCVYASRYGRGQTLERLAARGGFGVSEMDDLYPAWRDEVSDVTALRAENAGLRGEVADANEELLRMRDVVTAARRLWLFSRGYVSEGVEVPADADDDALEEEEAARSLSLFRAIEKYDARPAAKSQPETSVV